MELKEGYGAISVRAEFEAEGTKLEELLRLKEISMKAGLGLTLKIGGCESIRDMLEARIVGVNYLVAPMVESAYALKKYLQAVNKIFTRKERNDVEILCNIETITATNQLDEMMRIPEITLLNGIVIERVDLSYSMGLDENSINNKEVNVQVLEIIQKIKTKGLTSTVGGGVSAQSLPFFKSLPKGSIDRYETRKVYFSYLDAIKSNQGEGILKALGFEVLWLKNKINYYKGISIADQERMALIENKYNLALDSLI
jgi:hypothetical protein